MDIPVALSLTTVCTIHARNAHTHTLFRYQAVVVKFSIAPILSEAFPSLPRATVYYPLGSIAVVCSRPNTYLIASDSSSFPK